MQYRCKPTFVNMHHAAISAHVPQLVCECATHVYCHTLLDITDRHRADQADAGRYKSGSQFVQNIDEIPGDVRRAHHVTQM